MAEYGLTEKGFIAKPFQVILEEEKQAFKEAFGYDIDTSNESPEGAYIGNQAIKITQIWEMLEGLWAAGDPDSASGIYLDRIVSTVNVEREAAESTRVYTALWGDEGTPVAAGHLAKTVNGDQFSLQQPVILNREKLLGFLFTIAEIVPGVNYTFSLDGTVIAYEAIEGDTEETIQEALYDQIEGVFPGVYTAANKGSDGMAIHSTAGIAPFYLFCDDPKISIESLGALGIYAAVIRGPIFVAIGDLKEIVTNVSGLDSIINYASGITGRNAESDSELRIEKNKRQKQASGNEIAIENEVRQLPGVLYAKVYSNRTMIPVEGRPPKCYEPVVVGGIDQDIAEAVFHKGPGGIQSYGNTIIVVKDSEGVSWDVGFTRPQNRYVWIKIAYEKNSEETFPTNGVELIKNNIDEWGAANQGVGIDLVFQKLNRPIYDVSGIAYAEIKIAATDNLIPPAAEDYLAQNIVVDQRQIALVDKTRIEITEL